MSNIKKYGSSVNKNNAGSSWKWMIVFSYGLANILIIPVITSSSLIFKDKFKELNFTALEASLILNLNSALGMLMGLFNGALLNMFGFRTIAFVGGVIFSSGIISTAFAETFKHFLITYSIIASIGMGLCSSSFSLALNTYFKEDRNKAFGIGATITGIGPVLLPHLVTLLLNFYGTKGCVLVIGGLTLNIIVASMLLRPLKKTGQSEITNSTNAHSKSFSTENGSLHKPTPSISFSGISYETNSLKTLSDDEEEYLETCPIYHDVDTQSIYGFDIILHPLTKSEEILWKDLDYKFIPKSAHSSLPHSQSDHQIMRRRSGSVDYSRNGQVDLQLLEHPSTTKRWFESGSVASVNLGSSMKIFHEDEKTMTNFRRSHSRLRIFDDKSFLGRRASLLKNSLLQRRNTVAVIPEDDLPKIEEEPKPFEQNPPPPLIHIKKKSTCCEPLTRGWNKFIKVFDLGLLTDKIYLNIMIGIAIAIFAEINFSLLTPFILNEFNYTTEEIAIFMSTLATVDIFCRFASPFIGDFLKQPTRIMYMYALLMLIIMRTCLMFTTSHNEILWIACGMGIAKGVRQVYMSCIIPSYIPLDRLAAASGIQMVANGLILISMGSSIGFFRDLFGNYTICIIFINFVTFTTLTLWTFELIYMKRKNARVAKEIEENQIPELCKFNIEVN
ncbi:hypothetical protein PVAND_013659 [Polypedilum vanderplanki]|uniref:Monocarboxylate transporter n=1 Tax=Polypedilum vanderplanki TaxID=319348 RepID=A0A9J6CQD7_POLVA|nr:hypothetical protein PVAND_013659 [Polypedilum vanderplanki]